MPDHRYTSRRKPLTTKHCRCGKTGRPCVCYAIYTTGYCRRCNHSLQCHLVKGRPAKGRKRRHTWKEKLRK